MTADSASAPAASPPRPRVMTFFDGQNLFRSAKDLYGYRDASYDPLLLSEFVARSLGCDLVGVRFYTGVHRQVEHPRLFAWWQAKLRRMEKRGVATTQRALAYTSESVAGPNGSRTRVSVGREKGIDLRLGLDIVRLARERAYDAMVLFSTDNDLGEATDEVKRIGQEQGRFIHVYSAFPCGLDAGHLGHRGKRGIERTTWLRIKRADYEACLEVLDRGIVPIKPSVVPTAPSMGPTAAAAAAGPPAPSSAFGAVPKTSVDEVMRDPGSGRPGEPDQRPQL